MIIYFLPDVVEGQSEDFEEMPLDEFLPEKESPISVSSFSESPMSEPEHDSGLFTADLNISEEEVAKPEVVELEISLSDNDEDLADVEEDLELMVTDETELLGNEEAVNNSDVSDNEQLDDQLEDEMNNTNLDVLENDVSYEEIISAVENMVNPEEVVIVEQSEPKEPEAKEEEMDVQLSPKLPHAPDIVVTDPIATSDVIDEPTEEHVGSSSKEEVEVLLQQQEEKSPELEKKVDPVEVEESPGVVEEKVETVSEKENHPQMVRTLSNNG